VLIVTGCAKPHKAQEDNGRNQPKIASYGHKSWSVLEPLKPLSCCGSQGNPCSVGMPTSCGNIQNFEGKKKFALFQQ
jgi:hypothetical protein